MIQNKKNLPGMTTIIAAALLVVGCGEKTASKNESATKSMEQAADSISSSIVGGIERPTVDLVWDGASRKLHNLLCVMQNTYPTFIATSADESQIMNAKLKLGTKSPFENSFSLTIEGDGSQVVWYASEPEIAVSDEKTITLRGTAKGTGMRLGSDGNYVADQALYPENDMPFQATFSCN